MDHLDDPLKPSAPIAGTAEVHDLVHADVSVDVDTDDSTGASRLGRRRFLVGAAAGFAAASVSTLGLPGPAAANTVPAGATRFVPLPKQVRIADTRNFARFPYGMLADRIRVQIAGRDGVPLTATAAVLTVTAVNRAEGNYVTVFPAGGQVPEVSSLNMSRPLETAANLVTVRLGEGGAVDVAPYAAAELIVDVIGYYEPVAAAVREGRLVALDPARRVIDTRGTGLPGPLASVDVVLDPSVVPPHATSVVINLTTTGTLGAGYFTCFPLDVETPDETSNLNVNGPGETRAAGAIVSISESGGRRGFKVFTYAGGHVIVDVAGYYTGPSSPGPSTDGLFVPVEPVRILDTRRPGFGGKLWPNWIVNAAVPGVSQAQAVAVNLTAVDARDPGYFTMFPAGTPLFEVSNLNCSRRDETIPNFVISRVSSHGLAVYSQSGAHILIDLAGWFTGTPTLVTTSYVNPAPPAAGPPYLLEIPNLRRRNGARGLLSEVRSGSASQVTNSGRTWHWAGTGFMGQRANVGLFAHRTEAGSPLYNMHELGPGDIIYVHVAGRTSDRRRFRYRVVREDLVFNVRQATSANAQKILAATRLHTGTTISIIGCTRPDRLPTSLDHRLVLTAELLDWVEL